MHHNKLNTNQLNSKIMKTNYTLKAALMLVVLTLSFTSLTAQENVRILRVDPSTNSVTLKNFGDATAPVSTYWFCNFPNYAQVSGMTTVTTLAPNEEVNIGSTINFAVADGEFGLYSTNANGFGSSAAMIDYMQWGTAGHQRESVAVGAGVWDAGTFVNVAPPYEYTGDGTQNGVANWSTLGVNDFEEFSNLNLYPNPTNSILNIEIKNELSNGTVEVYDMLGKQIFKLTITSNNVSKIDVSNWNNGLYLVKISSDESIETKRFVKN
jgi:hypothetical protein